MVRTAPAAPLYLAALAVALRAEAATDCDKPAELASFPDSEVVSGDNGRWYLVSDSIQARRNESDEAKAACDERGLKLASLATEEEFDGVVKAILGAPTQLKRWWVGINYLQGVTHADGCKATEADPNGCDGWLGDADGLNPVASLAYVVAFGATSQVGHFSKDYKNPAYGSGDGTGTFPAFRIDGTEARLTPLVAYSKLRVLCEYVCPPVPIAAVVTTGIGNSFAKVVVASDSFNPTLTLGLKSVTTCASACFSVPDCRAALFDADGEECGVVVGEGAAAGLEVASTQEGGVEVFVR